MIVLISVVVGLSVALFLFSAIASTLLEIIAAAFSLRGRHLRGVLSDILGSLSGDFFSHPFFRQLARQHHKIWAKEGHPDKINRRTFGLVLSDVLALEWGQNPMETLHALPEGETKQLLLFLGRQSGHNLDRFRLLTENWFDEVMKASTAGYRRKAQWALLGIGCLLALLFNADIFQLYDSLGKFAVQNMGQSPTTELPTAGLIVPFFGWDMSLWPFWLLKAIGFALTGFGVAFCAPVWFDWAKKWMYCRGGQIWEDRADDALAEAIATGLELDTGRMGRELEASIKDEDFGTGDEQYATDMPPSEASEVDERAEGK